MGKGSGTSKTGITKKPQRLSDSEPAGGATAGSGSEGGSRPTNACLLRFTGIVEIDSASTGLNKGQRITLVQGTGVSLDVMSGGAKVGSFGGEEQSLLESCMAQGYVYKGVVETVDGGTATCSIKGYGVQNEPANNPRH
jgi:hypothetical protein